MAALIRKLGPLWLLPTAMAFVAYYQKLFDFSSAAAEFCRVFRDFFRIVWARAFAIVPAEAHLSIDDATSDLLTIWVTASLAIWIIPALTRGRTMTTVEALASVLPLPRALVALLAFVAIAATAPIVAAPVFLQSSPLADALQSSQIIAVGDASFRDWLSGEGLWLAYAFIALGAALLSVEFFLIGPRLANAALSRQERGDLVWIALLVWTVSAAFLVTALLFDGAAFHKADAMVLSLLALAGLVAWRSALPFVQIAVLIVAVFTIDAFGRFVQEAWLAVHGG